MGHGRAYAPARVRRPLAFAAFARVALAVSALAGCATAPETGVVSVLDNKTAVTITHVSQPIILTARRPDLAAFGRRHLHVGAVEVNTMGDYRYFLVVYDWATYGPVPDALSSAADTATLILLTDGEAESFEPLAGGRRDAGVTETLFEPPVGDAAETWYAIEESSLLRVVASRQLSARKRAADGSEQTFELWKDRRAELADFVDRILPADAGTPRRRIEATSRAE